MVICRRKLARQRESLWPSLRHTFCIHWGVFWKATWRQLEYVQWFYIRNINHIPTIVLYISIMLDKMEKVNCFENLPWRCLEKYKLMEILWGQVSPFCLIIVCYSVHIKLAMYNSKMWLNCQYFWYQNLSDVNCCHFDKVCEQVIFHWLLTCHDIHVQCTVTS